MHEAFGAGMCSAQRPKDRSPAKIARSVQSAADLLKRVGASRRSAIAALA